MRSRPCPTGQSLGASCVARPKVDRAINHKHKQRKNCIPSCLIRFRTPPRTHRHAHWGCWLRHATTSSSGRPRCGVGAVDRSRGAGTRTPRARGKAKKQKQDADNTINGGAGAGAGAGGGGGGRGYGQVRTCLRLCGCVADGGRPWLGMDAMPCHVGRSKRANIHPHANTHERSKHQPVKVTSLLANDAVLDR